MIDSAHRKGQLNPAEIRKDFPILSEKIYDKDLIYLDNAATTQKPSAVIQAVSNYYESYNSNVHRGVHRLSQKATDAFEKSRKKVQEFINAENDHEVIFTKGTTESINLVAASYGGEFLKPGDRVIISAMEHHANIVPWQLICAKTGAELKVIPMSEKGELQLDEYEKMLSPETRIVSVNYVSNTLGTINPVKEIIELAHRRNIPVLLDAAQAVQHMPIDVQALDVDFLAFSSHKIYGPTGYGVLYGKEELLEKMPPYQSGGEMIESVSFEKTTFNELPFKFETGTPHIAGAVGLHAALDYVGKLGLDKIASYEQELLDYALNALGGIDGLKFVGEAEQRTSAISFNMDGLHPYDVGEILDKLGIAVRTGHHCTEPIMTFFDIPGTVRASFSFYNTREEVDQLVAGIKRAQRMLS